jgi:hypothetical protein
MLNLNHSKQKENTLIAITIKDKINNDHKKANEIISKLNKKY